MSELTLQVRVQRLEDIEALKALKIRYAEACDNAYNPDEIAALFTEDAIWDGGPLGRYEGRATIHAFFSAASSLMPFAIHHFTNPLIEVDGDTASGRWNLWQPCEHASGTALWIAGRYQDEYRRENGVWRIAKLVFRPTMVTPYEAGWAKARFIEIPA